MCGVTVAVWVDRSGHGRVSLWIIQQAEGFRHDALRIRAHPVGDVPGRGCSD
jgi:hypothetical protein